MNTQSTEDLQDTVTMESDIMHLAKPVELYTRSEPKVNYGV